MYHGWISVFHPQDCPKYMCTCMHAGETMRCRFQGPVPSWTCLLFFSCCVEWLRAPIHWFNIEKKNTSFICCDSGYLLSCSSGHFKAAGTCYCNLHLRLNMSISVHVLTLPFLFFELHSHLKCRVFIFLELTNVISFFFITVRCWKPAWLMSLSFAF